jgi:2-iminobutanoate/2-iminopropanoate deaminase
MKKVIATPDAPKAVGPYSQAIEVNGTLYISGQIPVNPADGKVQEDIVAAAHQSLKNIGAILKEAGMDYDNVVKTTVLLADIADFKAVNEVYAEYFTGDKPARACYQAAALPLGVKVEIEAIEAVEGAVAEFASYIGQQTLAVSVKTAAEPSGEFVVDSDVNDIPLKIAIKRA